MNIEEKIWNRTLEFIEENKDKLSFNLNTIQKLQDSLLMKKLSSEVFYLIFEGLIGEYKFNLNKHLKYLDQKTWLELREFSSLNPAFELEEDKIIKKIAFSLSYLTIDLLKSKGNNISHCKKTMKLLGFDGDKISNLLKENVWCKSCDKRFHSLQFDTKKREIVLNNIFPCEISECSCLDHKMSFCLDTPSKELVFLNDIRDIFKVIRKDEHINTINSIYGRKLECEEYLKHNIAYITLSSGGIDILHSQKEKKVVMDFDQIKYYDPSKFEELGEELGEDEEDDEDFYEPIPKENFNLAGSISLGLWGVFVMDKNVYRKICKNAGKNADDFKHVSVKVTGTKVEVDYDLDDLLIEMKYS